MALTQAKIARQLQSKSSNPEYTFTSTTEAFSVGEVLAPIIAFGDIQAATVNRSLVEFFFSECNDDAYDLSIADCITENERLPVELGWTRRRDPVALNDILELHKIVGKEGMLITENTDVNKRGLHFKPMHSS